MYCEGLEPPCLGEYVFDDCPSDLKIYVPYGIKNAYVTAGWPEDNLYELAFIANTIEGAPIKYELLTLDKKAKTGTVEVSKFYDTAYRGRVTIPETIEHAGYNFTVTSIGYSAFEYCNLAEIIIPNTVTEIDDWAFFYCINLENINIPNSVIRIGHNTFRSCNSLSKVFIPDSVLNIGESAFVGCDSLVKVEFGSNSKLETIDEYTFFGCKKLNSFTIPSSVNFIGDRAFGCCYGLTEIVTESKMPATIGVDVFAECSANFKINIVAGMKEDYISKGWPKDKLEESIYFNITQNTVESAAITYQVTYLDSATGTGSVKVLYGSGRNYSSSITIPEIIEYQGITYTVTEIGEKAFEWYEFLEGITLPTTVTTIGAHAFECCSRLNSIVMPGVENIGYAAFSQCKSLNNITLPACIKNIDDFAFYKCSSLDMVTIQSETPATLGFNVFAECSPNLTIYIPKGAEDIYKNSESWSRYKIVQNNV